MKMKNTNSNTFFTQKEAAAYLQISSATLHNWIKSNKIKADAYQSKQPCFLRENIYALRERLLSGEDSSLRSRRNKLYSTGKAAYTAYLNSDSPNKFFFHSLFEKFENEKLNANDINMIIAECAARLYCNITNKNYDSFILNINELLNSENETGISSKDKGADYTLYLLIKDLVKNIELQSSFSAIFSDDEPVLFFDKNEDLLGLIYVSLRQLKKRKNSGAYYTPLTISRKMNEAVFSLNKKERENADESNEPDNTFENKTILDPSCGTGSFLLTLPESVPFDCIYGNDIDKTSISIVRINFFLRDNSLSYENLCTHFSCSDFLTSSDKNKFDFIIGNPPWGSNLDTDYLNLLSTYLSCASKKGADSFELFIEKSIQKLSDKGVFGLLIPHSFINVRSHKDIRDILLKNGYFCYFNNLEDVFDGVVCPGIFIVWSKVKQCSLVVSYKNTTNTITYSNQIGFNNTYELNNTCERIFTKDFLPVFISNSDYKRLNDLLSAPNVTFLKNNATFGLGIVTGNNKKLLIPREDSKDSSLLPILKGTDISRYKIKEPEYCIRYDKNTLQQTAPLSLYQCPAKLVYRFINKQLTFALDTNQTLTLNSCNFLIPHIDCLSAKYILAVLNSSISQFIFENRFSSVKVLRSHIEQLPIPLADKEKQQEICQYADLISHCENESKFKEYDNIIDELVGLLFT